MSTFLRTRRTAFRLSQAQLAERLKVSQQTIARWESGGQIPSKYLKDLAVLLGARVQDFIGNGEAGATTESPLAAPKQDDDDIPWGGIELRFAGDDTEPPRCYPISTGVQRSLLRQLGDDDADFGSSQPRDWIVLETLDDRWLAINAKELLEVKFVHDDVEPMPSFSHPEVYKAAREFVLTEWPSDADLSREDFPYSAPLMAEVKAVLDIHGGADNDRALHHFEHLQWETTSGRRASVLPNDTALDDLHSLFAEGLGTVAPDRMFSPSSAADGPYVLTYLRLGNLRLFEVPLQLMEECRAAMEF